MKRVALALCLGLVATAALPALAGNGAPTGAHYNLNIIGVENPKSSDMTGSNRHTIFVALGKTEQATSNIWLTNGPFAVCDGNGFDYAWNCEGVQIGRGQRGAVFQMPCNTAVPTDYGCGEGTITQDYTVWARALGKPGGEATITTCAYDETGELICATENSVTLERTRGKQTFQNVTRQLTTLQDVCFTLDGDLVCGDVSVFADELTDYFWQYQNRGLRLAQVRFYAD